MTSERAYSYKFLTSLRNTTAENEILFVGIGFTKDEDNNDTGTFKVHCMDEPDREAIIRILTKVITQLSNQ